MPFVNREHLAEAEAAGIVTPDQAERLWVFLAGRAAGTPAGPAAGTGGARLTFTSALYYLGGLLAVGAMAFFLRLGWDRFGGWGVCLVSVGYLAVAFLLAVRMEGKGLTLPMALLATLMVVLVPVAAWGAQRALGIPVGKHPLLLEFSALAAALVLSWRFEAPMLLVPVAVTFWLAGMDLAVTLFRPDVASGSAGDQLFREWYSVGCGLALLACAFWVDVRMRPARDYAFWLYLSGLAAAWGGLTFMESHDVTGKLVYLALNALLVLVGAALSRRAFTVFGAVGVAVALAALGDRWFKDSWLFPLSLTLIGLLVVAFGVWWSRNEARLSAGLQARLPAALREAIVERRSVL